MNSELIIGGLATSNILGALVIIYIKRFLKRFDDLEKRVQDTEKTQAVHTEQIKTLQSK